jgi:hypothetical protein
MAANSSYIIIKGKEGDKVQKLGYRAFFGPQDKGSAKPSFCYPRAKDSLKEDIRSIENALDNGYYAPNKKLSLQADLRTKKKKLDAINEQETSAKRLFDDNKDACIQRRTALQEEIRESIPTEKEVKKRHVNPFRNYEKEQKGLKEKKLEYIVLSHLAGEESNTSFLQKEQ